MNGINRETVFNILAWPGYGDAIGNDLKSLYELKTGETVDINFLDYVGGNDLLEKMSAPLNIYDAILTDYELVMELTSQLDLSPIEIDKGYLLDKGFYQGLITAIPTVFDEIFGLPLKWGNTSLLVRKGIADALKEEKDVIGYSDYLIRSKKIGIWGCKQWYLPAMSVFMLSVFNKSLLKSSDDYDKLEQYITSLLNDVRKGYKEIRLYKSVNAIGNDIFKTVSDTPVDAPDVIVSGGDWILEWMRRGMGFAEIDEFYNFVIPKEGILLFLECYCIPKNARDKSKSSTLCKCFLDKDILKKIRLIETGDDPYFALPVVKDTLFENEKEAEIEQIIDNFWGSSGRSHYRNIPMIDMLKTTDLSKQVEGLFNELRKLSIE